ncbi:MAG: PAS domain S-box protein, partial [Gemmatimonadota bacterium]|nr:PAS domain S-box protein [Gemmatimonadota bacterium]
EEIGESRRDLVVEARRFEAEEAPRAVLVVRDVTDARESERKIRASEHRLRLLTQQMPAILWTTDRELRFTSSTGSGLEAMGLEPDQVTGMLVEEFLGADHVGVAMHERAREGESVSYEAGHEDRTYETHVEPFRDEDGEVIGVIGVALDITERRRTEEKLEDQTAYFTQLFQESPEAIVLLDGEDRILRINREFTEMFGYSADEAIGERINDLVVPPDLHDEASDLSGRIASGTDVNVEAVRRRKDGTLIHVSILGTPIEVKEGRHIYGIYRDITERKRLEGQLLQSQKLEAVGRLAGGVAHDFNNLLTAILGHAQLIRGDLSDDHSLEEDLVEIERSVRRAAELTDQLLTFSRKDDRRVESLTLNDVVTDMGRLLDRLIGEDIEIETELASELPPVEGDPARVEQVIMNLAVNARDAMPSGGHLSIRTALVAPDAPESPPWAAEPLVMLSVTDEGTGMSREEQAQMFEPFYTTKSPGKGTGLGLATVYGIVESMSGRIDVTSELGRGTDIRLFFPPLPDRSAAGPATELPVEGRDREAPHGETILLVEDEPSVRRMARRALESHGYRVLVAEDGERALSIVDGHGNGGEPIDLLVSDIVMPGMSGHEVGGRIRRILPTIRAVFMSGYTDVRKLPEEFEEGDVEFLPKPFSPQTLARTVREILAR